MRRLAERLDEAGIESTMIVGVHGLERDEDRLAEYVPGFDAERCSAHERFFVDRVPGWVAERFGPALPAERTAVWGASLGAEFALAAGLGHPDVYGSVLAVSPGAGFRPPTAWQDELPRFYLVAGRQEPFFLDNAQRWAVALRSAGADTVMEKREGDHGEDFWFGEFPVMVSWAFGG